MIEEICPREQIKQFCPIRETMSAHIIKDSCQMHRFELHCKRSQIKYLREVEHELTDPNLDVNFGTCTWEDGGERSREQTQGKKDGLESCRGPANTAGKTRMVTYYYFKDKAWRKKQKLKRHVDHLNPVAENLNRGTRSSWDWSNPCRTLVPET